MGRTALVVRDGLAAQQWETHLLGEQLSESHRVFHAPPLLTYRNWLGELWSGLPDRGTVPVPITEAQSTALWRQTIAESAEGPTLIGHDGPAALAIQAWRSLLAWDIDPSTLQAESGQADFGTFLRWCASYRNRLRDANFVDGAQIERALLHSESTPRESVLLLDRHDPPPVEQKLLDGLRAAGCEIRHELPPERPARSLRIELANGQEELACAAEWARRYLVSSPLRRVALVVPDLGTRYAGVERSLAQVLGSDAFGGSGSDIPVAIASGWPELAVPAINAAFCGIELLSPRGTFVTLSRWLRSTHFHAADRQRHCEAALLETRLRSLLILKAGFLEAYRHGGLARTIRGEAPELAMRLDSALAEFPTRPNLAPSAWIAVWQRSLARLGWSAAADAEAAQAWERVLAEFAQLTPMLGAIGANTALDELERILNRPRAAAPLSLSGVHVFERVDDIGPGYDRAWITGFSDSRWPELARDNPLLPRRLQISHGMPWCNPLAALERSRQSLARLLNRVPELVLSWPSLELDRQSEPSALIEGIKTATLADLGIDGSTARPRHSAPGVERIVDPAPPLKGSTIIGGAQTLNHQAACPLRAFCSGRLGAQALDPFERGLSAGVQGKLAHRAAQLLFDQADSADDPASRLRHCVERALKEIFGGMHGSAGALYELERDRLAALLARLIEAESNRGEYTVEHLEERRKIRIESWLLRARMDRVDRLSDGTLAVLDYKTGRYVGKPDWFGERLGDTQLPLYALDLGERVSAAVIVHLRDPRVSYRGVWYDRDDFPGKPEKLPDERSWQAQIGVWREQLGVLAREYAGGDTRVFDTGIDALKGSYAPLSRIYEILASWQKHA